MTEQTKAEKLAAELTYSFGRNPTVVRAEAAAELRRLSPMEGMLRGALSALTEIEIEVSALRAECEALRKDANRYAKARHFIGASKANGSQFFHLQTLRPLGNIMKGSVAQHFDVAIDAAMGEKHE